MKIGDQITLGNYAGEPVVWQVIAEKEGRFLLLSTHVLEIRPMHPTDTSLEQKPGASYYETDWKTCELRQWLNGEFAASFTEEELAHIPAVSVSYVEIYKTLHSFFQGEEKVEDRFFPLSEEELKKYVPSEGDRVAVLSDHAKTQFTKAVPYRAWGSWWLRTSVRYGYGAHCKYVNNCVRSEKLLGTVISETAVWSAEVGVRPAMWYMP